MACIGPTHDSLNHVMGSGISAMESCAEFLAWPILQSAAAAALLAMAAMHPWALPALACYRWRA
eukprot:CAMPEP_0172729824 /NCGR_PEP_ID=MMETSP1074-20121228/96002_1 /TAXON_ID=2916 /ORGANISM="Ceratium fusus, Strain PA161109" /LENGTH=63 /DNA_ID=CAMNT_0013557395 /DNA_START=466 /DNA_END=653 /DNA_ORIENTATION=-